MTSPKQVIVMRKDLNMRKGKMVAQGSHASLAVILDLLQQGIADSLGCIEYSMTLHQGSPIQKWISEKFTKICVSVDSEAELLGIYEKARIEGIPCALITDSGATEFKGVPTNTCCALGPASSEKIDKITGHLKLL